MELFYSIVNTLTLPAYVLTASPLVLAVVLIWRKQLTEPRVAGALGVLGLILLGMCMTHPNFRMITTTPDNIPILSLILFVPFFTWLSLRKAVINDERMEQGKPVWEDENKDEVYVWPDLVYTELLALLACTVVLVVWAIYLKAPLENPADPSDSPNPSKAPWYFLGLQEMLVYFDPWLAGVVMPGMIVVGLLAIPYIDFNPKGAGYYSFKDRKFAISTFLFGFVIFWVVLILIGTFLRGPNWNFFGPFEQWTVHKVEALNSVNLSEYFWISMLGMQTPDNILVREAPGLLALAGFFLILPPLMAFTIFSRFYRRMGFMRYNVMAMLLLFWALMIIKMVTRWLFNLKYFVAIPEYFFNI